MTVKVSKSSVLLAAENPVIPLGEIWVENDTGVAKRGNGTTAYNSLPDWQPGVSIKHMTADQASTDGTNLTDVVQLKFPVAASATYLIEFNLFVTSAATTTGIVLALNGPASPTLIQYSTRIPTSATAIANGAASDWETALTAADLPSTSVFHHLDLRGYLVNGTTAGTMALRFRTEVNASAVTIKRGSWGRLTRLA